MIEKLQTVKPHDSGTEIAVYENTPLIQKVNELVDAVNVLQAQVAILQEHAHPTATTEPAENGESSKTEQDPFAEQRGWIGKACWFWDGNAQTKAFGQLRQIYSLDDGQNAPYQTNYGQWYEHCEPANDDIVYRGE